MIYPSKYNGINFSYDFNRKSNSFNFGNQRKKLTIAISELKYISFYKSTEEEIIQLKLIGNNSTEIIGIGSFYELETGYIYFFSLLVANFASNTSGYFKLTLGTDVIYSEIIDFKSSSYLTTNEICKITAYNSDSRHGYLTETLPAFGFFKFSQLNSDFFINSKVEYEYSYGRKMILSSENNIGKRLTFLDLTMYQQNLLKWLCNTENLFIDGVKYQLISDFTELLADENSEIKDLRADFVPVEQSFFGNSSTSTPKNIFTDQFFMK